MDAATIILREGESHTAILNSGKTVKFIKGRGQTVSDQELIAYVEGQPDKFIVAEAKKPVAKEEPKPKAPKKTAATEEDDGDDSPPEDEPPAPRGRRKRVKVE